MDTILLLSKMEFLAVVIPKLEEPGDFQTVQVHEEQVYLLKTNRSSKFSLLLLEWKLWNRNNYNNYRKIIKTEIT